MTIHKSRNSKKYREWRTAVFCRDKYRCTQCCKTVDLCAHHIVRWDDDKTLRYELSNGLTICRACHVKIHFQDNSYTEFGMKGKTHSSSAKLKMSKAKIGKLLSIKRKPLSEVTRNRMRLAKLGKKRGPLSEEHKYKIGLAHKGKTGRAQSTEERQKRSISMSKHKDINGAQFRGKSWKFCPIDNKRIWVLN